MKEPQAIKLGLGVIFANPIGAGGWSQGLWLNHAVQHSILLLTLHSTALLQCEGDPGDTVDRVTEVSASSGPSQQGRFGWVKSTHSTHTVELSELADVPLPAPLPATAALKRGHCSERGSWWEGGFAWQDAKTARAVVGFTAGSGLGKSLKQCRNPFFQVLRLKETCN